MRRSGRLDRQGSALTRQGSALTRLGTSSPGPPFAFFSCGLAGVPRGAACRAPR